VLAGLLPGAQLTIYPDTATGFSSSTTALFAADVDAFLGKLD
jgi:hypothetical protein